MNLKRIHITKYLFLNFGAITCLWLVLQTFDRINTHERQITCKNVTPNSTTTPRARFLELVERKVQSHDPDLIQVAQEMIMKPDQNPIIKISRNLLVNTPQAQAVREIFKNKKRGSFLECGAYDGETASNTVYLEHHLQWTGLLVEMDRFFHMQLRGKNRRAHSLNACISAEKHASLAKYLQSEGQGGMVNLDNSSLPPKRKDQIVGFSPEVPCFPVETLMLAMNITQLDYFSLDVEGTELKMLKAIPFDRLNITVLSVEHRHVPEGKAVLRSYMQKQGYSVYKDIDYAKPERGIHVNDFIFVRNSSRSSK